MNADLMTRKERTERLTYLRGREAARKVHISSGRLMDQPLQKRIAFAIFDPGAITPRGDNYQEPLYAWQARAVSYVVDTQPSPAEVLREAAASLTAIGNPATERGAGVRWAADWVRSMADTRGSNLADDNPDVEAVR